MRQGSDCYNVDNAAIPNCFFFSPPSDVFAGLCSILQLKPGLSGEIISVKVKTADSMTCQVIGHDTQLAINK